MDGYIKTIGSLDDYDPQALAPEVLEQALIALKQHLLKTEAAKLLLPAKEFPFSRVALGRLWSLLDLVFKPEKQHEPKVAALRGLDSVSLIICGLCLNQKAVENIRRDLFYAFLKQAVIASQFVVELIAKSDEINEVVRDSLVDEDFQKNYLSLRRVVNGTMRPSLQYSLGGNPSWCYSKILQPGSTQPIFPRLLSKAVPGYVTTFLPSVQSTDGLIRVMVVFDQNLLQTLFGWAGTGLIGAGG